MICYDPLFRLLRRRKISRTQLRKAVGFSTVTLARMGKDESVSLDIINKICIYLGCPIEDVVEIIPNEESGE